jgi:3-hydroxyacyl-CoA dehydrogenase / enoyl-CoA hydratase / 3-hydroxybutyryl-CoA epimerase
MDLTGLPFPENSPEPGECIEILNPEPGLAVVKLVPPHRSLAVLDAPLLRDLEAAVSELEGRHDLTGIVFAGAEPLRFAAGADVDGIKHINNPADVRRVVLEVHKLFRRIEKLRPRTVAAVGGPVPGGAFEMSLCCDFIVAANHKKTRIGLPETMLGIIPGWGGSHRLPKRVGVPTAMTAILSGRLYVAKQAKKLGMIDRLTAPEYLLTIASDIAMKRQTPRRMSRGWKSWLIDRNPLATNFIAKKAREMVESKTRGNYPAPLQAIDVIKSAPGRSMEEAAEREANVTADLAIGPVCKSLIGIFHASEDAKKLGSSIEGFKPRKFHTAGVLGGGVMGGGIASSLADKGVQTRLFDLAPAALDEAVIQHRADITKRVKRRRMQRHEGNAAMDRLTTARSLRGFDRAQIVIEAVAERLDVKQSVFRQLAEQVSADCILATNTSSLSVSKIAEGVPNPERVVGMHFFNPVKRMPLVEVVKGEQTSDEVAIEVAALAVKMGKTPVIVKDVAGFLVNRLLGPYLDEAVRLFAGGADPRRVDSLMLDFGMPMGPYRLLDEVGLDIAEHASASLHQAYGERMIPSSDLDPMRSPDRLGRKTGKGFYVFPTERKAKERLAGDLVSFQKAGFARAFSDEQIINRLALAMVNEAARCVEEDVVENPTMLDLATVFGTGFAPFTGGLLHYADRIGASELVNRLQGIQESPDVASRPGGQAKFEPAGLLKEMAKKNSRFFS